MKAHVIQSKQSTLTHQFTAKPVSETQKPPKSIIISELTSVVREDELRINVCFGLLPSRVHFSKVHFKLYFENQLLTSAVISVPQGSLVTDSFEFQVFWICMGVVEGQYLVRVEMFESWQNEKLKFVSKESLVLYVPCDSASRLVRIQPFKSVAGNGLSVVLPCEGPFF